MTRRPAPVRGHPALFGLAELLPAGPEPPAPAHRRPARPRTGGRASRPGATRHVPSWTQFGGYDMAVPAAGEKGDQ